jgi:hypothetical protein
MTDQLPAIIPSGTLTELPDAHLVPTLIADPGDLAAWRYEQAERGTHLRRRGCQCLIPHFATCSR